MTNPLVHPRLRKIAPELGQHLHLTDAVELDAAIADIQTLLHRCRYHLDLARAQRGWRQTKRRRARGATGGTAVSTRRGRHPDSANWASRQFGLGLAMIWFEQTGRPPTRRYDGYGDAVEHGPYRAFVVTVMAALPKAVRATRKGHVPEADHLVRTSIEEFKTARAAHDEARRRGLLDGPRWMGALDRAGGVAEL